MTAKERVRSPIDRFVLAKLEQAGLAPVGAADKRTLLRRVTFGLTGLPPTPEEIETFLQDGSPDAFAKVVDRLLALPAYGERDYRLTDVYGEVARTGSWKSRRSRTGTGWWKWSSTSVRSGAAPRIISVTWE